MTATQLKDSSRRVGFWELISVTTALSQRQGKGSKELMTRVSHWETLGVMLKSRDTMRFFWFCCLPLLWTTRSRSCKELLCHTVWLPSVVPACNWRDSLCFHNSHWLPGKWHCLWGQDRGFVMTGSFDSLDSWATKYSRISFQCFFCQHFKTLEWCH